MFKKNLTWSTSLLLLFLAGTSGCRTTPPLAPVDLSEAGWSVQSGQAVWRAKADAPEIAGDLLMLIHPDGRTMVQFVKQPFPLVIAQTTPDAWQIEAPAEQTRYVRRGAPPARVIWFQLPRAWLNGSAPEPWSWSRTSNETSVNPPPATLSHPMGEGRGEGSPTSLIRWRLENRATGEWLEGYFAESTPTGNR